MRVKIAQSGAVKEISDFSYHSAAAWGSSSLSAATSERRNSFRRHAEPKLRGLLKLHRGKAQRFAFGEKREDRPLVPFMADGIINH